MQDGAKRAGAAVAASPLLRWASHQVDPLGFCVVGCLWFGQHVGVDVSRCAQVAGTMQASSAEDDDQHDDDQHDDWQQHDHVCHHNGVAPSSAPVREEHC